MNARTATSFAMLAALRQQAAEAAASGELRLDCADWKRRQATSTSPMMSHSSRAIVFAALVGRVACQIVGLPKSEQAAYAKDSFSCRDGSKTLPISQLNGAPA